MKHPTITEKEKAVLLAWKDLGVHDYEEDYGAYLTFAQAGEASGIPNPRRFVRSLARKGFLEFSLLHKQESSMMAGSGHKLTYLGGEAIEQMELGL